MEFEVSFRETLRQLADAQVRLNTMGKVLDANTKKAGDMASAVAQASARTRTQFDNLHRQLERNGLLTEELSAYLAKAQKTAESAFLGMARSNTTATAKLQAFNGELGNLERLVKDTASKQAYTRWLEKTATLNAEAAGKTQFHITQLNHLSTAEGKAAVAAATLTQERVKSIREETKAAATAKALSDAHVRAYQRMAEAQRTAAQTASNYASIINQLTQSEREMAVTGQRLAWGYEVLTARQAEFTSQQRRAKEAVDVANTAMVQGVTNLERYTGANAEAAQAARRLADEEARASAARKRQMDELRKDIEERSRLREREQAEYARQANAGAITQQEKERARVLAQLRSAIEERYSSEQKSRQLLERLTREEATYQERVERANSAIKIRNDLRKAEAAASTTLSSAEARLTQNIQAQTAEYQRRAKYMQMTNAQLLGLSASSGRVSRDMNINAQAAAMFRAGLGGLNASIGIYTSATVLAASATYAVASAFRTGLSAGMEFTETMARAEAVMMSSTASVTAAGRSMEAVTMQVRALGASTLYTSTEVAGGLVDLGMAGLSASDAMTALSPALNLAAIGSIEMSRAADIATNVMTSFDRSASDLGNVVDIMATAITNSNTNIEQLSNALSYVGPAAQAAGFGLEDTTAAIELLSNAGIKASRAGTGLRRFMLNIQNPTAKGTAVLERFGISIINAEGQTRSMTDILGQFNRALHNDVITPAERTSAIMDLVGVRAQSAVARMISSFEEFGVLRRQLEEVDGAAEKMRETMEDVLSMDWRQLKSAFQDIQLDVFTAYEESLRSFTAQARLSLMELQSVNEEMTNMVFSPEQIANGDFVTELDVLIAKFGEAIDVVKGLGIAFLAFKGGKVLSTTLGALAANAQTASNRMAVLNSRGSLLNTTNISLTRSFSSLSASVSAHYANIRFASSTTERLTASMYSLSTAATYAARGLTMVGAALGWAGLVYGVYTAVTTLFSNDTAERISNHRDNVEQAKSRYAELQEQIDQTTEARQRLALAERREEAQKEAEGIELRLDRLRTTIELDIDQDSLRSVRDEIITLERRLADMRQQAIDAGVAIGQLGTNQLQFEQLKKSTGDMAFMLGDLRQATDNLTYSSANSNATLAEMASAAQEATNQSQKMRQGMGILSSVMALYSGRVQEVENSVRNYNVMMLDSIDVQRRAYEESQRFDNLSAQEKLNELLLKRSAIQLTLAAQVAAGADLGDDVFQRMQAQVAKLTEGILEYGTEVKDSFETLAEKQIELEDLQRNEIDTLETLEKKLQDVAVARMAMYAVAFTSGQDVNAEAMEELLDRQIELQQSWNQLDDRENKSSSRTTRNQELEEAIRLHERLRGSYDALGLAADTLAEEQGKLDYLFGKGKISAEQHAQASAELTREYEKSIDPLSDIRAELYPVITAQEEYAERVGEIAEALATGIISQDEATDAIKHYGKELEKVVEESDPLAKKLKELRDAYDSNYQRTQKLRKDLADINKLHREGAISGEQYARMWGQINDEMWDVAMEANPAAKEMARSWEEASNRIDETFADAFAGAFDSFDDFADQLLDGFKRLLAELAYQATLKPIVVQFTQQMGSALGIPGYGAAPGMGQQPGGGFNLGSMGSLYNSATRLPYIGDAISSAGSALGFGGSSAAAGGLYANALTGSAAAGGLYAGASTGAAVGGLYGNALTGAATTAGGGFMSAASAAMPWLAGGMLVDNVLGLGIVDGIVGGISDIFGGGKSDPRLNISTRGDAGQFGHESVRTGAFGAVGFSEGTKRSNDLFGSVEAEREWLASVAALDNLTAAAARTPEQLDAMTSAVQNMVLTSGDAQGAIDQLAGRTAAATRVIDAELTQTLLDAGASAEQIAQRFATARNAVDLITAASERLNLQYDANADGALRYADSLVQAFGSVENIAAIQDAYYNAAFSDQERLQNQYDDVRSALSGLTDEAPRTVAELRALVEAQQLNGGASQQLAYDLMALAPALKEANAGVRQAISQQYQDVLGRAPDASGLEYWFDQVASGALTLEGALSSIANSTERLAMDNQAIWDNITSSLEDQYRTSLGRDANAEDLYYWMTQIEAGAMSLDDALWSIANSSEAAEYAANGASGAINDMASLIRQREQLERQLLTLQGDTLELRRREMLELDPSLRHLQQRIWAIEDERAAMREAERAQQERIRNLEREARAMMSAGQNIRQFVESLQNTGKAGASPEDQFKNAEESFLAALTTIYQSDDDDLVRQTIGDITGIADDYLSAAEQWSGSGLEFQSAAALVESSLDDLADRLGAEEQNKIDPQLQALLDIVTNTGENGPLAKQSELGGQMGDLYQSLIGVTDAVGGVLTYEQAVAAADGLATNDELRSMFDGLDLNNDGIISKLESVVISNMPTDAILASTLNGSLTSLGSSQLTKAQVIEALSPIATDSEIARLITRLDVNADGIITAEELTAGKFDGLADGIADSIKPLFETLDTTLDGLIDWTEFSTAFDGLGTDEELKSAFNAIDEDMDGFISKAEAIAANTGLSGPLAKQTVFNQKLEDMFGGDGTQNYLYRQLGALAKIEKAINELDLIVNVDGQKSAVGGGSGGSNVDTTPSQPVGTQLDKNQVEAILSSQTGSDLSRMFGPGALGREGWSTWWELIEFAGKRNSPVTGFSENGVRLSTSADEIRSALGFSESNYFKLNPDVAAAVSAGEFGSGLYHYLRYGVGEGRRFAKGGIFTNSIVDSPTPFDMALMGEAGPEAIMPLTRGPDGALGVTAHIPNLGLNANGGIAKLLTEVLGENRRLRQDLNRLMGESNKHAAASVKVAAEGHRRHIEVSEKGNKSLYELEQRSRLEAMS